jgi:hypothetical protein
LDTPLLHQCARLRLHLRRGRTIALDAHRRLHGSGELLLDLCGGLHGVLPEGTGWEQANPDASQMPFGHYEL